MAYGPHMARGLLHRDGRTRAPLGVWWFDGELHHEYPIDDADALERGRSRVHDAFELRTGNSSQDIAAETWAELVDDLDSSTPGESWWDHVDVGGDPVAALRAEVSTWMTWRDRKSVV